MRPRRQGLQVSTFPFLAVLLCAMGSLILLLLVIDRRAKAVARAKALRAQAQVSADETKAEEARRAEWERRRRLLHEQLLQEDQEVLGQVQAVREKARSAVADRETEKARAQQEHQQERQRLQAEQSRLARLEEELSAKRTEVTRAARQAETSQAEMARLTAELERIEHTLSDLKAARLRQQQMYSLVPYRGKRGDNRKPLYLECTSTALVFHPDRFALGTGPTLSAGVIRAEIEHRLAARRAVTPVAAGKLEENAYLLMLVRPDGITTYYRTVAALHGLKIDFGYEFVDKDWILDFPEDDTAAAQQSWMAAETVPAGSPGKTSPRKVTGLSPGAVARTQGRSQGVAFDPGSPREGLGTGPRTPGGSGRGRTTSSAGGPPLAPSEPGGLLGPSPFSGQGLIGGTSREVPGGRGGTGGEYPGTTGANGAGPRPRDGFSIGGGRGPGGMGSASGTGAPGPGGAGQGSGTETPAPGVRVGLGPPVAGSGSEAGSARGGEGGGLAQPVPLREGAGPASPGQPGVAGTGSGPADATGGGNRGASSAGGTDPTMAAGAVPGVGPGPAGAKPPALDVPPSLLPSAVAEPSRASANPGTGAASGTAAEGGVRGGAGAGQGEGGETTGAGPRDPLANLAARGGQRKPGRPLAVWPGLLTGNRDWILSIECKGDGLVIASTGQRFEAADLARDPGAAALRDTLAQMIARRQASVRPGEPPYRPMIRFRVRPEGMRTYYLAYPALEGLGVKMTRESIEAEEEAKKTTGGH